MLGKLVCLVLLDSNSAEVKGRAIHDGGVFLTLQMTQVTFGNLAF